MKDVPGGFRLVRPTLLRVHTEQDETTRDVVVVEHPDKTRKAYYKSTDVSGGGYRGAWVPFEGWVTHERVPAGKTFTDIDAMTGRPFGHNGIMGKTYWNCPDNPRCPDQKGAQAPPGTIHAEAAQWLANLPDSQIHKTNTIAVEGGTEDNIRAFGRLNRQLWKLGAIDRSSNVMDVDCAQSPDERKCPGAGRRLQFGLDEIS